MKNPFKKLSKEAKGGIIIASATILFFGSIATIGVLAGRKNPNINDIDSLPVSVTVPSSGTNTDSGSSSSDVSKPVENTLVRPTLNEVGTIRYFFDPSYDADDPKLQKATYKVGSTIHQSRGMDFANTTDAQFDVLASAAGKVKSITPEDRLYGNIVVIESDDGITCVYAGVKNVQVKVGEEVAQGKKIAESGTSSINGDNKNALHFEVLKDGKPLNPEKCFDKNLNEI